MRYFKIFFLILDLISLNYIEIHTLIRCNLKIQKVNLPNLTFDELIQLQNTNS